MGVDEASTQVLNGSGEDPVGVTIINFSHPLSATQSNAFESLSGWTVARIVDVPTHCDQSRPFAEQAVAIVDTVGLTPDVWQSCRLAILPPALTAIACLVIAEIHGRAGHFVPVIRIRPRPGTVPPVFDVAEILDVQGQRDEARSRRSR
jgi:hypothetical protein